MLLPIAVFLVVSALLYALALPFIRGRKNGENDVLSGGKTRPLIFGPVTVALAGVLPCTSVTRAKITKDLRRGGYYHRFALEEFLSFRNAMVIGWVFLIGTLVVVAVEPDDSLLTLKLMIAGSLGAILLHNLPVLVMRNRANTRVGRIQFALPDALDMITMCTTGGLPLQQALTQVSAQLHATHPDLATELKIMGRQMKAAVRQANRPARDPLAHGDGRANAKSRQRCGRVLSGIRRRVAAGTTPAGRGAGKQDGREDALAAGVVSGSARVHDVAHSRVDRTEKLRGPREPARRNPVAGQSRSDPGQRDGVLGRFASGRPALGRSAAAMTARRLYPVALTTRL